ncbi:MAG: hypothetical protein RIB86_18130, partial [Imperialibacter sp.]
MSTLSGSSKPLGVSVVESSGIWYLFATSRDNNKLFRYTYGNGLQSAATSVDDLGTLGGLLAQPVSVKVFQQNGVWYGLIHNWTSGKLVRVDFSGGVGGTVSGTLMLSGVGGGNSGMEVVKDGEQVVAIVTNTTSFKIIDFGNDITQVPDASHQMTTTAVSGATLLRDISLYKDCDIWYGFAIDRTGKKLFRLNFGTTAYSNPSATLLGTNILSSEEPGSIQVLEEGGGYNLLVNTLSGHLQNVVLGSDITSSSYSVLNYGGSYGIGYDLIFVKDSGEWTGMIFNDGTKDLYRLDFPDVCSASVKYIESSTPGEISYDVSGTYKIELTAYSATGNKSVVVEDVVVGAQQSPDITFSYADICLSSPTTFTSTNSSGDITTYSWDFDGDGIEDST